MGTKLAYLWRAQGISPSNALVPETYASLLRFADWIWQASLSALSARGDSIPGAIKLANIARQGLSGHHYVIMVVQCCGLVSRQRGVRIRH